MATHVPAAISLLPCERRWNGKHTEKRAANVPVDSVIRVQLRFFFRSPIATHLVPVVSKTDRDEIWHECSSHK